jgi:glyoxylase-like metal-dependent hydrolase (beta-lactamase superfamily II)
MPQSVEQTFVPVAEGIRRRRLPLPTGPRHVHVYLVDGERGRFLLDTGLGIPEEAHRWDDVEADRIVITHMHPDHVGGADRAARLLGATVHQGRLDYAQCEHVWGSGEWPDRMARWFLRNGVPEPVAAELIEQGHAVAPFIRFAWHPELLDEGDVVDGWEVVALPGHADGHIGLLRDGVLLAGDHLLDRISPAVGLYPESRPDPLGDYLASLERTIELDPRVVYPGHGDPIERPADRARELIAHHRDRLERTAAALAREARTGYEVSLRLFQNELGPAHRRFAVAETLSHLERLVAEGGAARADAGGCLGYTLA